MNMYGKRELVASPHLLLMGGGENKDLAPSLEYLVKQCPADKKVLFLPQAMEESFFSNYLEFAFDCLEPLSFPRERLISWPKLEGKNSKDFESIGAVWLGGGNTFKLLHEIRNSGFSEPLLSFIHSGGIVGGNSAGAIILGKDIRYAHDPNEVGIADFKGFNLLREHAVWCHYKPNPHNTEIADFLEKTGTNVLALSDSAGAVFRNGSFQSIGTEPLRFFTPADIEKLRG